MPQRYNLCVMLLLLLLLLNEPLSQCYLFRIIRDKLFVDAAIIAASKLLAKQMPLWYVWSPHIRISHTQHTDKIISCACNCALCEWSKLKEQPVSCCCYQCHCRFSFLLLLFKYCRCHCVGWCACGVCVAFISAHMLFYWNLILQRNRPMAIE